MKNFFSIVKNFKKFLIYKFSNIFYSSKLKSYQLEFLSSVFKKFKKNKKVIFITPVFYSSGGVEKNTLELIKYIKLKRKNYYLIVFSLEKSENINDDLHIEFKKLSDISIEFPKHFVFNEYLNVLKRLKEYYKPISFLICNGSPWLMLNLNNIRKIFKDVKIVNQMFYDHEKGWINYFNCKNIKIFDHSIAVNLKIFNILIDKFYINKNMCSLICSTTSSNFFSKIQVNKSKLLKEFKLPKNKNMFLFAGRLVDQKNPIKFLEFCNSRINDNKIFFLMFGNGYLEEKVKEFIKVNKLTNIKLFSFTHRLKEFIKISSGLIITSDYEGLPITLLEASLLGIPTFSTDTGIIKDFLKKYKAGISYSKKISIYNMNITFNKFEKNINKYRFNLLKNNQMLKKNFSHENTLKKYFPILNIN
jgi:glycosyltransferase involved in cell wall biosynthesis